MEQLHYKRPFSIAMLNYWRVDHCLKPLGHLHIDVPKIPKIPKVSRGSLGELFRALALLPLLKHGKIAGETGIPVESMNEICCTDLYKQIIDQPNIHQKSAALGGLLLDLDDLAQMMICLMCNRLL